MNLDTETMEKRSIKTLIAFILVFFGSSFSLFSQEQEQVKVLFVGNSFIYFYNMPMVVASMVNSQGGNMLVRKSTVGGSNLEQHWKGEKGTQTMQILENEKWDYVVFNNHSRSAYETPESFMRYGKLFTDKVRSLGAKPVFMTTWAYHSNPLMQERISKGYDSLANVNDVDLVLAGPLFSKARRLRPDLSLFHDNMDPT